MLVESLSSHDCADSTRRYLPLTDSLTRSSIGTFTYRSIACRETYGNKSYGQSTNENVDILL